MTLSAVRPWFVATVVVAFAVFAAVSAGSPPAPGDTSAGGATAGDLFSLLARARRSAEGGNMNSICLGCTFVTGVVEQLGQVHNETIDKAMERLCSYLPHVVQTPCQDLIAKYGASVIKLLEEKETPDRVCQLIDLCQNKTCRLFPPPEGERSFDAAAKLIADVHPRHRGFRESPWQWIVAQIERVFNEHKPLVDFDKDDFGSDAEFELRGSAWKGGDCDDTDKTIYPGRRNTTHPANVDHNCNGIYGTDADGVSYEEKFCAGTGQMGIAILGDSVGAHFDAPFEWLEAAMINNETFKNFVEIAENELDWPAQSATTGHENSTWVGRPAGPVKSLYLEMVQRNRCIHRAYQTCAVNGARSSAMASDIMYSLAGDQAMDHPMLVSYALVGNDVCNGHPGMGHMTTPSEFYANVNKTIYYLDTVLAPGSQVTFTGLIDGRIIWDTLADTIYPLGELNQDITYATYWEWLNCLESNPCRGWMNGNATFRNATTQRAWELNAEYPKLIANEGPKIKNFNMTYFDNPFKQVIELANSRGIATIDLFAKVIGMHPNQVANALLAEVVWKNFTTNYPYLVIPENPNNAAIEAVFGNQGGY